MANITEKIEKYLDEKREVDPYKQSDKWNECQEKLGEIALSAKEFYDSIKSKDSKDKEVISFLKSIIDDINNNNKTITADQAKRLYNISQGIKNMTR